MKKEKMARQIPKGQYCHGELVSNGDGIYKAPNMCPWYEDLGVLVLHRDEKEAEKIAKKEGYAGYRKCDVADKCVSECWTSTSTRCKVQMCACKFEGVVDKEEDTYLWDQLKICDTNLDIE